MQTHANDGRQEKAICKKGPGVRCPARILFGISASGFSRRIRFGGSGSRSLSTGRERKRNRSSTARVEGLAREARQNASRRNRASGAKAWGGLASARARRTRCFRNSPNREANEFRIVPAIA